MARAASVYHRGGTLYAVPQGQTARDGHREIAPVRVVHQAESAVAVGEALLAALADSGVLVEPGPSQDARSPVEEAAGETSWKTFIRGTAACDLEQTDAGYVVSALEPARGGAFEFPKQATLSLPPASTPEELGRAVLGVIDECERQ